MLEYVFLLLPVAACSGWLVGRRSRAGSRGLAGELSSDYYAGLNFLLNEQTDKAVEAFIRMLEASPESVETTLALGNFFRRRGEVSRAIGIHQSLVAKPNLTSKQRTHSLLELAQDYMHAGVYDRAESLLLEITYTINDCLEVSLRHLIDIYEREKDWEKAIAVAARLAAVSGQPLGREIAHYYCELAEESWSKGKIKLAYKHLKRSLRYDSNCARASILQGNFAKKMGSYHEALRAYQYLENQDVAFFPEIIFKIIECYERLEAGDELSQYLNYLMHHCPSISIVLANAEQVKNRRGKEQAAHLLTNYMYNHPSVRGLKHLIEFHLTRAIGEVRNELLMLKSLIEQLLETKPIYRCGNCGFASRLLQWQCPSCRQWAAIKPIQGIEGE